MIQTITQGPLGYKILIVLRIHSAFILPKKYYLT